MKTHDLSQLTDEQLNDRSEILTMAKEQEYAMDGSGECGPMIEAAFNPEEEAVQKEMQKRGFFDELDELDPNADLPF